MTGSEARKQVNSVQSLSHVLLFATPWTAACQASLSITNSRSLLKLMSIESVMPSNHLILCRPLLLLPSIFPSIRVFSNESAQGAAIACQDGELNSSLQGRCQYRQPVLESGQATGHGTDQENVANRKLKITLGPPDPLLCFRGSWLSRRRGCGKPPGL